VKTENLVMFLKNIENLVCVFFQNLMRPDDSFSKPDENLVCFFQNRVKNILGEGLVKTR
jgi:hypothetical protein